MGAYASAITIFRYIYIYMTESETITSACRRNSLKIGALVGLLLGYVFILFFLVLGLNFGLVFFGLFASFAFFLIISLWPRVFGTDLTV